MLWTYMEYHFYTYMFTDEAFIMTSGYIMRNELAALYHQIQNVSIQRRPLDRLAGVSKIVIFMNGAEKDAAHNKIVLPAVGKTKAKLVQKELLMRARQHMRPNAIAGKSNRISFCPLSIRYSEFSCGSYDGSVPRETVVRFFKLVSARSRKATRSGYCTKRCVSSLYQMSPCTSVASGRSKR